MKRVAIYPQDLVFYGRYQLFIIYVYYIMPRKFTLEYWMDDGWYVGKLKEVPGVFSQGKTFDELKSNIIEVFQFMVEEE